MSLCFGLRRATVWIRAVSLSLCERCALSEVMLILILVCMAVTMLYGETNTRCVRLCLCAIRYSKGYAVQ